MTKLCQTEVWNKHGQARDHPYITSAKGLTGVSRKWPVSLKFNIVFMMIGWVGGVQKGQKNADVI